ncbi:lipopolysaccharide biosynthesis protein [Pirellulales bacterium]|nr:lipopolysaccharide biosynthesis protein [Pirellulales bacterium]MDA7937992.1 lipopolysaccharide biosynthesis protein [Pirellulales bacterium]
MTSNIQNKKIRRLSGEAFVVVGSQAIAALAGLVGLRFITTLLSRESFGELSLAMTAISLIQLVFTKPFSSAVRRFYAVSVEENKLEQFTASCWQLALALATSIVLVGTCCFLGLLSFSSHVALLCVLAFLVAGLQAPGDMAQSFQVAARNRVVAGVLNFTCQWLRVVGIVSAVLLLTSDSVSAVIGMVGAYGCWLGLQILAFKKSFPLQIDWKIQHEELFSWWKRLSEFARPIAFWGFFIWLTNSSSRWSLEFFQGSEEVGSYAALFQLGYYPMYLVAMCISEFLTPILFGIAGDNSDRREELRAVNIGSMSVWAVITITVLVGLLTIFIHPFIFQICVDQSYAGTSYLLPVMLLASGFIAAAEVATLAIQTSGTNKQLTLPKIITSIVGSVITVLGAYLYGLQGVLYAGLCYATMHMVWTIFLLYQLRKKILI